MEKVPEKEGSELLLAEMGHYGALNGSPNRPHSLVFCNDKPIASVGPLRMRKNSKSREKGQVEVSMGSKRVTKV